MVSSSIYFVSALLPSQLHSPCTSFLPWVVVPVKIIAHPFLQQILVRHMVCARHCWRHWGYREILYLGTYLASDVFPELYCLIPFLRGQEILGLHSLELGLPELVRDPGGPGTNAIPQKNTMRGRGGKPGRGPREQDVTARLGRRTSEERHEVRSQGGQERN